MKPLGTLPILYQIPLLLCQTMHPSRQPKALLLPLLFFLSTPLISSQTPIPTSNSSFSTNFALDYGRIIQNPPREVLLPKSLHDITLLLKSIYSTPSQNNITVAARGAAHSTYGQAEALGGIVINMQSLPKTISIGKTQETQYADAAGGVLWIDLLKETLKQGLTPQSWTDYLYLTIGGTLSVGGVSGQAFKFGPQIVNVLEIDVITGEGENLTCSREVNSDLFYGVLGGLGQFGIITRARIILSAAPKMAKRVQITYDDFDQFTRDQELLISMAEVNYLEGTINFKAVNSTSRKSSRLTKTKLSEANVDYTIEFAIYYDELGVAQKTLDFILSCLNVNSSAASSTDLSYFDFLNRVKAEEDELRRQGLFEVPHPWLNLFVPRAQVRRIKDLLLETITENTTGGLVLIYPTLKNKWDPKMSAVLPEDHATDIMYVLSILRSAPQSCTSGSPCLESFLEQNKKIIDIATSNSFAKEKTSINIEAVDVNYGCISDEEEEVDSSVAVTGQQSGLGAKQYLPYLHNEREWSAHFGERWERFKKLKSMFDPLHILAPGQRIFRRKCIKN